MLYVFNDGSKQERAAYQKTAGINELSEQAHGFYHISSDKSDSTFILSENKGGN